MKTRIILTLIVIALLGSVLSACNNKPIPPACKVNPDMNGWIDCTWSSTYFEDSSESWDAWGKLTDEQKAIAISQDFND